MGLADRLCAVVGAVGLALASEAALAQPAPNVVLILADDLGYGDVSSYNPASDVETVHIDALAAEGIRFTNAHAPSAICTPTRYGILTGRHPWRDGRSTGIVVGLNGQMLPLARETLAEALRGAGYHTAMVGKWHLGLTVPTTDGEPVRTGSLDSNVDWSGTITGGPTDHGFDHAYGSFSSHNRPPHKYFENDRWVSEASVWMTKAEFGVPAGDDVDLHAGWADPGWDIYAVTRRQRDKAVEFIASHAREPFFLYVALSAPHAPNTPHPEFHDRSPRRYTDFVVEVDDAVGRIVEALSERGVLADTLLVVTSDNGADHRMANSASHRGTGVVTGTALRGGKFVAYEGGHRVPFIARWGDGTDAGAVIRRGVTTDELTNLTDVFATVTAIAGARSEGGAVDSVDILPALLGDGTPLGLRDVSISTSANGTVAVTRRERDGDEWKLIFNDRGGGLAPESGSIHDPYDPVVDFAALQLFDLARDVGESTNLLAGGGTDGARAKALELQDLARRALADVVVCPEAPRLACRPADARRSVLRMTSGRSAAQAGLTWKLLGGPVHKVFFGQPQRRTGYALCVYDAGGLRLTVAPKASATCAAEACWREYATGFRYDDPERTADGLVKVELQGTDVTRTLLRMKAGGERLPVVELPLGLPVRAQLHNSVGQCWDATYSAAAINRVGGFRARSD